MSNSEDLKIFLNILAQSPQGLSDPALIGKFSQAKATQHAMGTMQEMQSMQPPVPPPGTPPPGNMPNSSGGNENQAQTPLGDTGVPPPDQSAQNPQMQL